MCPCFKCQRKIHFHVVFADAHWRISSEWLLAALFMAAGYTLWIGCFCANRRCAVANGKCTVAEEQLYVTSWAWCLMARCLQLLVLAVTDRVSVCQVDACYLTPAAVILLGSINSTRSLCSASFYAEIVVLQTHSIPLIIPRSWHNSGLFTSSRCSQSGLLVIVLVCLLIAW